MKMRQIFCAGLIVLCTVVEGQTQQTDAPGGLAKGPKPAGVAPQAVGDELSSCTTPGSTPVGIENNGSGNLWMTDIATGTLFLITPTCTQLFSCSIAANTGNPIGVTTNGTTLWVTDTSAAQVDAYDTSCNFQGSFSVIGQTTFPEGITFNPDTGTLFVVDGSNNPSNVFEYNTSGTLLNTFPLTTNSTDGIAYDSLRQRFVIYDSASDSVTIYDTSFVAQTSFLGTINSGFSGGEGVALIGQSCFVIATGSNLLVEYECFAELPIPTLPQWGMILLTLSLLTIATWQLAGRPVLVGVGRSGQAAVLPERRRWLSALLWGQGVATLGLLVSITVVGPLVPHDGVGALLSGVLIGVMIECYRRGRSL
ncbi:MAG: SdiA-regulated domain-containing protein [Candidatus Binatia bacterium]